ncbi:MAG: hypothetical protein Q9187_007188 [Circinaria calcarea]
MAGFFKNLFEAIFTPGPTPTLIVATNVSFAALQALLLALLVATYSIHFIILSFLCGALWLAINWFVTELAAAKEKEAHAKRLKDMRRERDDKIADDSGTETEGVEEVPQTPKITNQPPAFASALSPESAEDSTMKKRRSLGEASGGDMSTDSEWDKVEDEEDGGK